MPTPSKHHHHHLSSSIQRLLIAVPILCCLFLAAPPCFAEEDLLKSPVHFQDYKEIFGYIATEDGLFNDPEMILQLSNDCKVEYIHSEKKDGPLRAVLTANLIDNNGVNILRGASGNGAYYVLQFTPTGMDLVGILVGNGWKNRTIDGHDAFVTTWHMSAFEYVETIYDWNGSVFAKSSSRTVKETMDEHK